MDWMPENQPITVLDNDLREPLEEEPVNAAISRSRKWYSHIRGVFPGLFLTGTIAAAAFALRQLPGLAMFRPMILAILTGIAFHNLVGTPVWAKEGVTFSLRQVLRVAIILLGLQLTAIQLIEVGGKGAGIVAAWLIATFAFTVWMGGLLDVERKLAQLIAAGPRSVGHQR